MTGTLKGYDQLLNLVLDEATENLRGEVFLYPLLTQFSCCIVIVRMHRSLCAALELMNSLFRLAPQFSLPSSCSIDLNSSPLVWWIVDDIHVCKSRLFVFCYNVRLEVTLVAISYACTGNSPVLSSTIPCDI